MKSSINSETMVNFLEIACLSKPTWKSIDSPLLYFRLLGDHLRPREPRRFLDDHKYPSPSLSASLSVTLTHALLLNISGCASPPGPSFLCSDEFMRRSSCALLRHLAGTCSAFPRSQRVSATLTDPLLYLAIAATDVHERSWRRRSQPSITAARTPLLSRAGQRS